jgi:Flp pilus assembly pilin Flp
MEKHPMELFTQLVKDENGQGITEYALILGLVVLGIWAAVSASGMGASITSLFGRIKTNVAGCTNGNCGG